MGSSQPDEVAKGWTLAGSEESLKEGDMGLRFELPTGLRDKNGAEQTEPGFVVRADDRIYGYLNRCGHVPVELDWPEGQFFDDEAVFIVCATHGASYSPQTGDCLGGPCAGRGLVKLEIRIQQGSIWARLPLAY